MTSFIRNDFNETKRLFDLETEKAAELDSSIQFHKRQQEEQANKKKIRVNDLESRQNTLIEEIKHIEIKIKEATAKTVSSSGENKTQLMESISALKIKEREVLELDKQYTKVIAVNQTTVLNIKSKIKELEKLSDGMCAYCKQPFSESNIQEKKNLIANHQSDINDCNVILEDTAEKVKQAQKIKITIEDMRDDLNQKYRAIELQESELSKLNSEMSQQNNWLKQTIKDLENANKDADSFEGVISELTIRRDTLKSTASTYEKKLKLIESAKFVVSDEGVKNFIVKKMLKMLNGRLNYYLKQLDANCTCVFNEYFDETIINNIGRECSYFNFSGGEQTRIDLSMLFTFKDIRRMQSNVFVNMGIYDELLDTSLDSKGIECTLNILKERVTNNQEAIYIISHKNEAVKHATGEIIYLEKENNITRRKIYEQFTDRRAVPTSQNT
jgi:myosin heavy subunit